MRVCSVHGCGEIYPTTEGSRCQRHAAEADRRRGNSSERGYSSRGHQAFRRAVLHENPVCIACHIRPSTDADHYPRDRRELVELGLNANDPQYGRALCHSCHSKATAANQPGGWNRRH